MNGYRQLVGMDAPTNIETAKFSWKNLLMMGLLLCFFAGLTLGAFLNGSGQETGAVVTGFLSAREQNSFGETFLYSLTSAGGFLLVFFLSGFSAIGQPAAFFLLLMRGMGLGATLGHFYLTMGSTGAALVSLILVPPAALSGYALVLGARESVKLSNRFFLTLTVKSSQIPLSVLKRYGVKFLILTAILLSAALLDSACTAIFLPLLEKLAAAGIR